MSSSKWFLEVSYDIDDFLYLQSCRHFRIEKLKHGSSVLYYLTSPHLDIVEKSKIIKAYTRARNILRYVNGLQILIEGKPINIGVNFLYKEEGFFKNLLVNGRNLIYEDNPFDYNVTEEINNKILGRFKLEKKEMIYQDFAQIIVEDDISRTIIMLLTFTLQNDQILLDNSLKILELIYNDFRISRIDELQRPKDTLKHLHILESLKLRKNTTTDLEYSSLYGYKKKPESKKAFQYRIPSAEILKDILVLSISEYMKFKCYKKFGILY